jgi:hypothetical protein
MVTDRHVDRRRGLCRYGAHECAALLTGPNQQAAVRLAKPALLWSGTGQYRSRAILDDPQVVRKTKISIEQWRRKARISPGASLVSGAIRPMPDSLEEEAFQLLRYSERFRKVSHRYPRRVAEAYGGDLTRAMKDSDDKFKATVTAWERRHGLKVTDWIAEGEWEREGR